MRLEIACSLRARLRGLLGRETFDGVLLLVPCNDIHTFGMHRPLDIAFVARDGIVLESHRGVPPGRRLRNARAAATLERFATDTPWFNPGDAMTTPIQASRPP